MPWSRKEIADRVVKEFSPGQIVSLGMGLPSLVAEAIDPSLEVLIHGENGLLGQGPQPAQGKSNPDVANAAGEPATLRPGGAFFDAVSGSVMMRGGHVDICVLGAFEVDQEGNLANWMIPGGHVAGMGGAPDLVVGSKRVIAAMTHLSPEGAPKLVTACGIPVTASRCVNTVVTDLGVFEISDGAFECLELAPDIGWEDVEAATGGSLVRSDRLSSAQDPPDNDEQVAPDAHDEEEGELVGESDWQGD